MVKRWLIRSAASGQRSCVTLVCQFLGPQGRKKRKKKTDTYARVVRGGWGWENTAVIIKIEPDGRASIIAPTDPERGSNQSWWPGGRETHGTPPINIYGPWGWGHGGWGERAGPVANTSCYAQYNATKLIIMWPFDVAVESTFEKTIQNVSTGTVHKKKYI